MARIPLQIASRQLDTGPTVDYSAVSSSPVGRALEELGGVVQTVGNRFQQMQEEKDNFSANQGRLRMGQTFEADLPSVLAKVPQDGSGLHDNGLAAFDKRANEFLSSVPQGLRPQYQEMIQTERTEQSTRLGKLELGQRQVWYRDGIKEAGRKAEIDTFNDPSQSAVARENYLKSIDASGLDEAEKAELRKGADITIAKSIVTRQIQDDPASVSGMLGVAPPPGVASSLVHAVISAESSGNPNAISPKGAAGLMQVMPATGSEIASEIGDANFPMGSVAEQQAYLQREDVSVRYGTHYLNKMLDRYGGDVDAALVAYNGGPARADAWLAAGRSDAVIPKESADYYKKVRNVLQMAGDAGPPALRPYFQAAANLPLIARGGKPADLTGTQPVIVDRLMSLQNQWGRPLPINSAYRDPAHNARVGGAGKSQHTHGNAIDLDVSKYSTEERTKLIEMASAMGFTGIGVYDTAIHLDMGSRRSWGPSHHSESIPGWAQQAIDRHLAGQANPGASPGQPVDPRLEVLSLSDRLAFQDQANREYKARTASQNAAETAAAAAYKDGLEVRALRKDLSEQDVLGDPLLDDGARASLIRTVRSQIKDQTEAEQAASRLVSGGLDGVNPLNSDDAKSVDKGYETLLERLPRDESFEANSEALTKEVIRRTNVIPQRAQAGLRSGVYSKNPQQFAAAMDAAGQIEDMAPIAFDSMANGADLRRDLTSFRYMVNDLGLSAEDAGARMLERRAPDYKRNLETLGPEIDKAVKDLKVTDLSSVFDPGVFSSAPGAGPDPRTQNALLAEYRDAFRDQYLRTGDEGEAKALAGEEIKKTWGVSTISGGSQIMKFPPEKFYPVLDGGHDYLREDAMKTAAEFSGGEVSRVTLLPVSSGGPAPRNLTAADIREGRLPRYQVMFEHEVNGQTVFDAVPGTWAFTSEMVDAKRGQALSAAEAERQRMIGVLDTGNEGIGSFMMSEPPAVVEPPRGVANTGRTNRFGSGIRPTAPPQPASGYIDPAALNRGVGAFPAQGPQPGEKAADIKQRLQDKGRFLRRQP